MSIRRIFFFVLVAIAFLLATGVQTTSLNSNGNTNNTVGLVAGRNVNMVSGQEWPGGDPFLQRQNEPSVAVSTRNPLHLLAGSNDYRSIDAYKEDELPGFEKASYSSRDAWVGYYTSYDGGQSWTSTLLPGYIHYDTTPPGAPPSPLMGFEAAADPVVRAGTNGLFYYSGITFNRGQRGLGQVFVARFIDNNNKETGAIEYIDTKIIDVGNSGHFIDKPCMVVDIPRLGSPMTTLPNGQIVPCGNLYIVYTSFMGDLAEDAHSKMMFSMSTDCGETWSKPSQITDAGQPYQAATLAINPIDGRPFLAYRRFAKDKTDAIMLCWAEQKGKETMEGYWHGKIKFSKPMVLAEIDPYDQPTSDITFRTNDYPTMTIDKYGVIYVAWSQRGEGPQGEGKIMMMTSADGGVTWVGPALVDDPALSGYEFMPSLTSGAGKVMMLWYDQQYDICGHFDDVYIQESYPIRHTIDVRAAQVYSVPTLEGYFSSETIQVSRYPWVLTFDDPENPWAEQLQYNMPNLRIFGGGTVPFFGDYIDISPSPMFVPQGDGWTYNSDPASKPVYHAVWTDNRDVRPPGPDGNWIDYIAPKGQECDYIQVDQTGIRNQNIYTSRITEGIIAGSPGNTKPLNINRAFVVFVKNTTDAPRDLILEIVETSGATAYFMKAGVPVDPPDELPVTVLPYSSVSATVMVDPYLNEYATVRINVYEGMDLLTYILLNPDSTNPGIEPHDGYDPDTPHVGSNETRTPHVGSRDVINWDYSVDSPHVGSRDTTSPHVGSNRDWVTPHVGSGDGIRGGSTIHVGTNDHIIMSNIVNPHVGSDSFPRSIPEDSSMTDVVWTVENRGNTTSTYSLSTFPNYDEYNADKIAVQLIVYKVYTTPTALGCELFEQEHHELILSQTSPHVGSNGRDRTTASITSQSEPEPWYFDATFSIPPKGQEGEEEVTYKVILRYMDKDTTDDIELDPEDQGIFVDPEAPEIIDGVVLDPVNALVITTRTQDLDNGIVGTEYNETLEVEGGYGNYAWSLGGDASDWLSITGSSDGFCYISGSTAVGTYSLIVTVEDTDPDYGRATLTATKTLSIIVRSTSPTLISPAEGAELDNGCDPAEENIEWDFDWSDVSGATKYHLYVQHTGSPLPLIDDQEVTASEYHYVGSGYIHNMNRFDWIWKVRALVSGIWSEWSVERSFDVEPLNTDCPLDVTPPAVTSFDPADDASGVALDSNLVITFDENVVADTGNIDIKKISDDSIFETIVVTDAGKVSIVDNVVTINPVGTFEFETGYYVQIVATCFKDAAGNHYGGITDKTIWNFTTVGDLVAYYPFSGNANDESGNGNHGTVDGAILTQDRFNNPNSAYAFDGIDDYIEIPDSPSFSFNYPITISAWIYLDDNSKGGIVGQWGYGGAGGDAFILYVRGTKLSTYLPREGLAHLELQSNNGLATNQWYLVSMVSTGNLVTLYINGNEDKSEAVIVKQVDSYQTVEIGLEDRFSGGLNYLDGIIDEVRIYNRALTETEIQALYSLESGLVAHYPFNGDADDESGNGLNGTVSEATLATDRSGNTNRAYNFDGDNDMIAVSDHSLLDITSQISLSAWIYPTETKTQVIIRKSPNITPPPPYGLALSATGDTIFNLSPTGVFTQLRKTGYELNKWSFIVGTYDGTTMKLYVNGNLEETLSTSGSLNQNDDPLLIGTRLRLPADTFKGKLDNIRIYNRVLSADEIRALYVHTR
jgi:hypothetical protein